MSWTPERGCIGKRAYFDKREAKKWAASVNVNNRLRGDPEAHVYRCPCGYYHIGRPIGTNSRTEEAA